MKPTSLRFLEPLGVVAGRRWPAAAGPLRLHATAQPAARDAAGGLRAPLGAAGAKATHHCGARGRGRGHAARAWEATIGTRGPRGIRKAWSKGLGCPSTSLAFQSLKGILEARNKGGSSR